MSFCPTKDIHSIYLDNEMPLEFKKQYEDHLASCAECRQQLAVLRGVHSLFAEDSAKITPDKEFLDKSFERLQLKLSYSKNSKKSDRKLPVYRVFYGISAAAAVALFAVLIPVRMAGSKTQQAVPMAQAVAPVSPYSNIADNVSFGGTGKGVVISGNIHESVLSPHGRKPMIQDINSQNMTKNLINNVDVIKPDLGDKTISIRITVPGFNAVPFTAEVDLPVNVMSGFGE